MYLISEMKHIFNCKPSYPGINDVRPLNGVLKYINTIASVIEVVSEVSLKNEAHYFHLQLTAVSHWKYTLCRWI